MNRKKNKTNRTERLTISLSAKEKSFLKAYQKRFNKRHDVKFSYGDIILLLCNEKATREKLRPTLKQLSLFDAQQQDGGVV